MIENRSIKSIIFRCWANSRWTARNFALQSISWNAVVELEVLKSQDSSIAAAELKTQQLLKRTNEG